PLPLPRPPSPHTPPPPPLHSFPTRRSSDLPNVNPVSACIGPRGDRVAAVVEHLHGEKIDIVQWSEDPAAFIASALSPAKVLKVEDRKSTRLNSSHVSISYAVFCLKKKMFTD